MGELDKLQEKLEHERPVPWQELPDIALYMDQVVSYMPRQLMGFGRDEALTSAMVNNYIKDGLVPRAEGKRYTRAHLGYLTAVCAIKKVLPVKDIRILFDAVRQDQEPQALYDYFLQALDQALSHTAESLGDRQEQELPQLALELALHSYADQLACAYILDILREKGAQSE